MKIKQLICVSILLPLLSVTSCSNQAPTRDNHTTLIYNNGIEDIEVSATLYQGDGYSIYIPDEGWIDKGNSFDSWGLEVAPRDVSIHIETFPDMPLEESKQTLTEKYTYYNFLEDETGWLNGYSQGSLEYNHVYMISNGKNSFAMWIAYADESVISYEARVGTEARGYSGLLRAIAESAQVYA